ncbi:hypothetical protein D3C87_2021390 [compost metagenome]
MFGEAFDPFELIFKLGAWKRITIGQIQAANNYSINKCFNIAAMQVFRVFIQAAPGFLDLAVS